MFTGPPHRSCAGDPITATTTSNNGVRLPRPVKAIEARGLAKTYGTVRALDGIDLEVEAGEFFGLAGPNGAGKTTLLRVLTGQIAPSGGTARVLGFDPAREPLKVKAAVGIVPEVESPPSYLTAAEYLYFVGRVRDVPRLQAAIDHWLEFFDLTEAKGTICRDLSKGTRQKLMLASAFLHGPDLLFLDEPFINLDPIFQRRVKDYLLEYSAAGHTVFMASHLLDIAEKLCDRVAVIDAGRVIAHGSVAEVRREDRDLESAFLRLVGERR